MYPSTPHAAQPWRGPRAAGRLILLGFLLCGLVANLFVPARGVGAAAPGGVYAWGDASGGQLGSTARNDRPNPGAVSAALDAGIVTIASGQNHSLALRQDGVVLTWGSNFPSGQGGQNSTADRLDPAPVVGVAGVSAIASGYLHSLAVSGGNVYTWGDNNYGQLGTPGPDTCNSGECSRKAIQVPGLTGVTKVGAGARHSLAVLADGTVRAWGINHSGALGDGSTTQRATPVVVSGLSGVAAVAGGEGHSLALKSDGTVWAWGQNVQGQLGLGAADTDNHPTAAQVPGLTNIVAIAAGYRHSLALRNDGTLFSWGHNSDGQLGNGTIDTNRCACNPTPAPVPGLAGVTAIAAGASHSLAAVGDGTVRGWGFNSDAQVGVAAGPDQPTPVVIGGLAGATVLAAGGYHSLALRVVPQFALGVSSNGTGTGTVAPGSGNYDAGSQVTLTAQASADSVFTGWTLDGAAAGGTPTLTVAMNANHTVVATFNKPLDFCDVNVGDRYFEAIRQLSARGVIRGFEDGDGRLCFAPDERTKRAQMAALIARPLGWDQEDHGNGFSDQNGVDANLWRNVGTLFFYEVAKGYKPETCQALGVGTPCYGPTDEVVHAQVISFITRGMVKKGYWQFQPDNAALYPNVPGDSGHRVDIATYLHYVGGTLPGTSSTGQSWNDWDQPAQRDWFAESLWRALSSYFGFR